MSAHTPGPWSYRPNGEGWHNLCGADGRSIWTASARTDEDAANRALIAAAPDLREERQAIANMLGSLEWSSPEHAEALLMELVQLFHQSAAIAKAEGRQP